MLCCHVSAGTCTAACARPTPWIFQHAAERFLPPYFFQSGRPVITAVSVTSARYAASFTARYTGTVTSAVLMAPGAVTHQVRHIVAFLRRCCIPVTC
jgi:4-amino-4-deoxy-L-arabinose transferase-like glycosyltransferase